MQRQLNKRRLSEEEEVKAAGLNLDFDEIAKRGSMSKEEHSIAKWYGVYGSRQKGDLMARIVVPGGVITTAQARQIAATAEHFAEGRLNVTTRQAIQYHRLKVPIVPDMLRELARESITTYHGCGDVNRTTSACAMAENCVHARLNVRPFARETSHYLASCHDLDNLPRKFKITWSGCRAGCAQPFINCLGMIAVTVDRDGHRETGFRVVMGGGMGWMGFVASELFTFVPADRAVLLTRAVALLFRDHGDRFNRAKSRLKFVVHHLGTDRCREIVVENLRREGVSTEGFRTEPAPDVLGPVPNRPLIDSAFRTADGSAVVRVRIPKGEMTASQLRALAEISDTFADQRIYTTNRQNIELHGIDPAKRTAALQAVHALDLETDGIEGIRDIVPCVGTAFCPKAVGTTRDLTDLLEPVVRDPKYAPIDELVRINITGCPNSCSPYRIVDIGFRGMRIREQQGSVEGWEMLIGGDQTAHGQKLGDFKMADCPAATRTVLDTYLALRQDSETLTDCLNRVGIDPFRKAVFDEV
ncbi:MAG: nitrite/sulfite reductase [Planctomycetes bacterium]|nr:nitrite/sulfite reductase [Planctomycetota bacterium]